MLFYNNTLYALLCHFFHSYMIEYSIRMYEVNNPNNRLNVLELHRKINQRNEKKSVCYEKVLEICNKRILAQTERDKTNCMFEFPEYVLGYPLFDLNMCIKFCEKHLVANGFLVKYLFPNKFYISWDFDEIKKHKEEERKKIPLVAVLPKKNIPQQITAPKYNIEESMKQIQSSNPPITNPIMTSMNTTQSQPQSQPRPSTFLPQIDQQIHAKMTQPLPTTLPKYNPFDLYSPSIHDNNHSRNNTETNNNDPKKSAIDNSFFANSFKQTLTSGIGTTKIFEYKPSGKLTLNL
jgi:Family of unknown function (DUF5759)